MQFQSCLGMTIRMTNASLKWFPCLKLLLKLMTYGLSYQSLFAKMCLWSISTRPDTFWMMHTDECTVKNLLTDRMSCLLQRPLLKLQELHPKSQPTRLRSPMKGNRPRSIWNLFHPKHKNKERWWSRLKTLTTKIWIKKTSVPSVPRPKAIQLASPPSNSWRKTIKIRSLLGNTHQQDGLSQRIKMLPILASKWANNLRNRSTIPFQKRIVPSESFQGVLWIMMSRISKLFQRFRQLKMRKMLGKVIMRRGHLKALAQTYPQSNWKETDEAVEARAIITKSNSKKKMRWHQRMTKIREGLAVSQRR